MGSNKLNQVLRVLLLDDDSHDQMLITRLLKKVSGTRYEIVPLSTVADALNYLELEQDIIDACLVDFNLGMDTAFDFLKGIEQNRIRPLPIVVMTGLPDEIIDKKLMECGVSDYWSKDDFHSETLERCIRHAIHRHENLLTKTIESSNKTNYLAQIAHELKNPLNAIYGFSRVAERRWKNIESESDIERVEECFHSITTNCNRLKSLIEELLNHAKIEAGHLCFNKEVCELKPIVTEVLHNYTETARKANLALNYNVCEETIHLEGDRIRLFQIFSNLISNAIKYTEKGHVEVRIKIMEKQSQRFAHIEVEDTGIGIKEDQFEAVFSEYETVHSTLRKSVDSTGLGMPITKKLVELHGGSIDLRSKEGQGSTFIVSLPLSLTVAQTVKCIEVVGLTWLFLRKVNIESLTRQFVERGVELVEAYFVRPFSPC